MLGHLVPLVDLLESAMLALFFVTRNRATPLSFLDLCPDREPTKNHEQNQIELQCISPLFRCGTCGVLVRFQVQAYLLGNQCGHQLEM